MNKRTMILATALAVAAIVPVAYGRSQGTKDSSNPSATNQAHQLQTESITVAQRSAFRHCLYTSDLARKHLKELAGAVRRRGSHPDEVRQHLEEVRVAVSAMLEDHHRFISNLTEDQWTKAKETITKLEQLHATINAQLQGFDYELAMPTSDLKVLEKYTKRTDRALQEWRKQHRRIGDEIGLRGI